jgi:GTP1/Obg family GTP-binding protein
MEVLLEQHELLECLQKEIADEVFAVVNAADTAEQKAVKDKKLEERSKNNRKCKSLIIQDIADSHNASKTDQNRCGIHCSTFSKDKASQVNCIYVKSW